MPIPKTFLPFAIYLTCSIHFLLGAEVITTPIPNFDGTLEDIQMHDTKNGWAIGQTEHTVFLLCTEDGGQSWRDISPQIMRQKELITLEADGALAYRSNDSVHGWALCIRNMDRPLNKFDLFSTEDGGRHWREWPFKFPVETVVDIQSIDDKRCFIGVESDIENDGATKTLYHTVDGGQIWQVASKSSPGTLVDGALPPTGRVGQMVFRNDASGWIIGWLPSERKDYFFHTADGGKTWKPQPLPLPQDMQIEKAEYGLPTFFGPQKTEGVVSVQYECKDPDRKALVFYGTHDGGEHWAQTGTAPVNWDKKQYITTAFADADRGWVVANDALLATTDRGVTWSEVKSNLPFELKSGTWQTQFVNATQGWILITKWETLYTTELLQTEDGGRNWTHCFGAKLSERPRDKERETPERSGVNLP